MAEAVAPVVAPTAPAAAPAAAEPDVARNPDGTVDITAFAAAAKAALDLETAEGDAVEAAARAEKPAKPAAKQRDEKGHFTKDKDEPEKPEAPKEAEEKQEPGPSGTARLQRLFREGKFEEWWHAATGQSIDSAEAAHIPSKALARARVEYKRVAEKEQWVTQQAKQLHAAYAPMEQAWKLRDAGDYRGAVEALFNGESLESIQGKIVGQYHKTDPAVMQTRQEIQQLRAELAKQKEQEQLASQRQTLSQQQAKERETLVSYLSESDDPRISRVSEKKAFVDMVIKKAVDGYDRRLHIGIPWSEAAEQAYDELYGGVLDDSPASAATRVSTAPGAAKPENSARSRNSVKRNLDPKRSAEASPLDMPEPGSREMAAYWARQATMANARG